MSGGGRLRVRRLLQPGGPLFWSYLLYRIRGHQVILYEVRFADSDQRSQPIGLAANKIDHPLADIGQVDSDGC